MLAEMGAPIAFELELDASQGKTSRAKCRIKLPKRSWVAATTCADGTGSGRPQAIQKNWARCISRERNRIDLKPP